MAVSHQLGVLGLAAALLAVPAGAQSATPASSVKPAQEPFVLSLEGLTAANQAAVEAALAKVPTVAKVTVDTASGSVSLATGEGVQLDTDAAKAAVAAAGAKVKDVKLPAWSAETVWVVVAKGGS